MPIENSNLLLICTFYEGRVYVFEDTLKNRRTAFPPEHLRWNLRLAYEASRHFIVLIERGITQDKWFARSMATAEKQ